MNQNVDNLFKNIFNLDINNELYSYQYLGALSDILGSKWINGRFFNYDIRTVLKKLVQIFLESQNDSVREYSIFAIYEAHYNQDQSLFLDVTEKIFGVLSEFNDIDSLNNQDISKFYYPITLLTCVYDKNYLLKYKEIVEKFLDTKFNEEAREIISNLIKLK